MSTYWYQVIQVTRNDGVLIHRFVDDDEEPKQKERAIAEAIDILRRQTGVQAVRVFKASEQEIERLAKEEMLTRHGARGSTTLQ